MKRDLIDFVRDTKEAGGLTDKQRDYFARRLEGEKPVDAAEAAYDCKSRASAQVIAKKLNKSTRFNTKIQRLMEEFDMGFPLLLATHHKLLNSKDETVRLRALKMAYKLGGFFKQSEHAVTPQKSSQTIDKQLNIYESSSVSEIIQRIDGLKESLVRSEPAKPQE